MPNFVKIGSNSWENIEIFLFFKMVAMEYGRFADMG